MNRQISFFPLLIVPLAVALLVSFFFIGLGTRQALSDMLNESLDSTLNERSEAIRGAINGFESVVAAHDRNANRFIQFIKDMVADPSHDDLSAGTFIQINDDKGRLIVANRDAEVAGLTKLPIGTAGVFKVRFQSGVTVPLRFIRYSAAQSKPVNLIISVGRQVDVVDKAKNQLTAIFLRIMVPSLIVLFIFLLFLGRRLTKPLTGLVREIGGVEAVNLHQSISSESRVQEIGELTAQFNRMLLRLDLSFSAQKRFVADVSHQFRTPLTVMAGQIQTLLALPRDNAAYREIMESNLDEIHELDHLLDVLLNLTRLETQNPIQREMTNLNDLFRSVMDDFLLVAESRHCHIDCNFTALPLVAMDRSLIRQALINLFDNATKYGSAGDGGHHAVLFETGMDRFDVASRQGRPAVERIWFRSTNWGPVIPAEDILHLGERFYRGKAPVREGVGLGLSLVHLVADLHQGSMSIESDAQTGTQFTLSLPCIDSEGQRAR